jgi:hypothetical protein
MHLTVHSLLVLLSTCVAGAAISHQVVSADLRSAHGNTLGRPDDSVNACICTATQEVFDADCKVSSMSWLEETIDTAWVIISPCVGILSPVMIM